MAQSPQPPGMDVLKILIGRIKDPVFLFGLAVIVAIALFGAQIPPAFVTLIYLVVGVGLILYTMRMVAAEIAKARRDSTPPPKPAIESAPPGSRASGGDNSANVAVAGNVNAIHIDARPLPAPPDAPPLSESEQLATYLEKVKFDTSLLRLGGLSPEASNPQKQAGMPRNPGTLAEVFISLRIDRYRGEPGEKELAKPGADADRLLRSEREQLTALESLSDDRTLRSVLLGQPGAGKSSVLRYLAFRLAEAYLQPALLKETMSEWRAGPLLPVVVSLARLADDLPPKAGGALADGAQTFITREVESSADLRGFAKRLWREARERGALFLFDGLDEVAPDKRAMVKDAITAFLSTRSKCRAVVTCRTFSYGDEKWRLEGWPPYQLEPLTVEQQDEFIQKWYAALSRSDPASKSAHDLKEKKLKEALLSGDARQLGQLASNPLLLTLITTVHTDRDELPRSRIVIYEKCVELLLFHWQKRRQPGAPLRSVLEEMAQAAPGDDALESKLMDGLNEMAYRARESRGPKQGESTLIDLYALRRALAPYLPPAAIAVFEDYCQSANGLLLALGSRHLSDRPADEGPVPCFAFPHPSFEEYLAAQYIAGLEKPKQTLAAHNAESDRWFYVGLFLGEHYGIRNHRLWDMLELFDELLQPLIAPIGGQPLPLREDARGERREGAPVWRNVWLAGVIWPIFAKEFSDRLTANQALEKDLRQKLKTLCAAGELSPRERADAGRALATLGDPRDLEELVPVRAGLFWMGSEEEGPQHQVTLPAYRIGKYPVTVGLWKKFVAATQNKCDPDSLEGPDNHPAHDVSWHDACTFGEWLTDEWRKTGKIGADETARLPTEAEWEKAARGDDKREWPWGNEFDPGRANTSESGIGRACAVGIFPSGESPYGCLDMAGNVWEWTRSKIKDYPYHADDGREELEGNDNRVLRGGSFDLSRWFARCACRYVYPPVNRNDNIGLRLVVSPGSRF